MKKARAGFWIALAASLGTALFLTPVLFADSGYLSSTRPVARGSLKFYPVQRLDAGATNPETWVDLGSCSWDITHDCLMCMHGDGGLQCVNRVTNAMADAGEWHHNAATGGKNPYLNPSRGATEYVVVGHGSVPDAVAPITALGQWDGGTDGHQDLQGTGYFIATVSPSITGTVSITDPTPNGTFESVGVVISGYTGNSALHWSFEPGDLSIGFDNTKSTFLGRTNVDCGDIPHFINAGYWVRFGAGRALGCEEGVVNLFGVSPSFAPLQHMTADVNLSGMGGATVSFWETFGRAGKSMQFTRSLVVNYNMPDEYVVWSVAMGMADQLDHLVTATLPSPLAGIKTLTWLLAQTDNPIDPDGTADYRQGTLYCRGNDDISYAHCAGLPPGVLFAFWECLDCVSNCSGSSSSVLQCAPESTPNGDFTCTSTTAGGGGQPLCWQPPSWTVDDVTITGSVPKADTINVPAVHGLARNLDPGAGLKGDEAGIIHGGKFEAEAKGSGNWVADGGVVGVSGIARMTTTASRNYVNFVRGGKVTAEIPAGAGAANDVAALVATVNSQPNPDGGVMPDGGWKSTQLAESVATHATIGRPTVTYRALHVYAPTLAGATPGITEGIHIDDLTGLGGTVYGLYSAHTGAHYIAGTLEVGSTLRIDAALSANGDTGTSTKLLHGGASSTVWSALDLVNDITGTLAVTHGGTGAVTLTNHGVLLGQGTSAVVATAAGSTGTVFVGSGASADPVFSANPSATSLTTSGQGALVVGPYGTSAGNTGELRFKELAANGTDLVAFKAPDSIASTTTYTLPNAYPASTGYVLSSTTAGVLSWVSASSASSAALTEVDDTNVTLTLGGSPSTALLAATSLTLGWTGTLSVSRGGSGAGTFTSNGVLYGNGTSAFGVTSQGAANSILTANAGAPAFSQTPIVNTSLQIGVASSQTGALKLAHSSSANLTTIQAGNASSALSWTWPIADGSSGDCMKTNASGVLSFGSCISGAGTIGGSIASTQVAYGSGSNTIAGSSTLTYDGSTTLTLAASANSIAGGIFKNGSSGANALGYVEAYNDQVHGYLALVSHSSGYTTAALQSTGYIQAGDSLTNGLWLGTLANAPIKFLVNTTGTNNETFRIDAGKSMAISSRFEEAQGANVASANTLTLGTDGSYFKVTGTTTIKGITTANWQAGSRITLDFTGAPGPTVNHNDGTPGAGAVAILLAGAANMTTAARTTLDLRYDGTNWIEVSRNAGAGGGLSGLTANGAVYPTSSSAIASTAALTNGQVLIGSTSSTPVAATITAGTNVTVTNGAGTITIAATGGSGINSGITDPPMLTLPGSGMTFSDEFTAFSGWTFSGQAVASGSVNPTSAFTSGTSAGVYDVATRSGWLLVQPGTIATSTITQFARTDVTLPTNCTIVARLGTMTNIVHSATDDAAIFLSLDDQTVSSTKSVYAGSAGLTGLEIGIRILSNATGGVGYWFTTHAATLGNELNTTALRQELRGTIIVALIKKSTQYWGYVGDGTNWIYLGTTTAITNTMSRLKIEMLTPQANASDPNAIFSIDFIRVYDGTSAPNNVVWF